MFLKTVSTGSIGNCYLLQENNGETLILDCGVPLKDIKKGLDWNIRNVAGCIVTHEHKDHSRSVKDLRNMGIRVIAPYESGEVHSMHFKLGGFDIQAFEVPHNGTWCNGFYIKTPLPDEQRILYMTDLEYCPYSFKKQRINHMLIECNYIADMVDSDLPNFCHKVKGHCELQTTKGIVETNNSTDLRTVILCHIGCETCDNDRIVAEVQKVAPQAHVCVAEPWKTIELRTDNCPF